jgi:phage gpG-like protein
MAEQFQTNAAELAAGLNAAAERIGNPRPALESLRRQLAAQESEVWATEGRAIGVSWPPSADPDRKVDSRLLVATGALRDSLTDVDSGVVEGDELQYGTDVPYGRFHQYGTSRTPQRQFLGISPELARNITQALSESLL